MHWQLHRVNNDGIRKICLEGGSGGCERMRHIDNDRIPISPMRRLDKERIHEEPRRSERERGREMEKRKDLEIRKSDINHQHELDKRNDIHQRIIIELGLLQEMNRIDFGRRESQRIHEEQMRMIYNNFKEQLRSLQLQLELGRVRQNNIFSQPNNEEVIKKLNRFILNDENCKKYKDENIEINTCCICLYDLKKNEEVVLLSCKHIFHWNCGLNWFKIKNACPICRCEIK